MTEASMPGTRSKFARVILAIVGGYAFSAGFISLGPVLLAYLGMQRGEAMVLCSLIGLFAFVAIGVWLAATRYLFRSASCVVVGAAAMIYFAPIAASRLGWQ